MTRHARPHSPQPLPVDAVRVFAGELFDVYQWQQVQFDGTSSTFEKVRRPDTALVLPVIDGLLRICRQRQPGQVEDFYTLIGGRVEPGEDPERAARREMLEEAGLVAVTVELWTAFQPFPKIDWAMYLFVARGCDPSEEPTLEPGERLEFMDVTLKQLLEIVRSESFRDLPVALHLLREAGADGGLHRLQGYLLG